MTTGIRDALAGLIRQVDGDNKLSARDLGAGLAAKFPPFFANQHGADLVAFVERANPDKAMGAGVLADAIVDEFNLEDW